MKDRLSSYARLNKNESVEKRSIYPHLIAPMNDPGGIPRSIIMYFFIFLYKELTP